jgi:PGF-pre-PGF domain-containing protein
VSFFDNSTGSPTSWLWDFGDGVSSTEQNPMHIYVAEGNYTVNLTISNNNGTDSKLVTIKVVKTNPYAYVTNYNSNAVSVIDTTTNKVTATVPVGRCPWGVAVSPEGTRVYVTNWNSNTVSVIDTTTNTVTATVNVGSNPMGIAITPDGKKVYVTNTMSNNVSIIDTTTNTVTATVNVGSNPTGVAVTPDGTKVYVTKWGGVDVIDTATNSVTAAVGVGWYPIGIAVSPDGSKVYLTHSDIYGYYNMDSQAVSVINTATNNVTAIVGVNSPTTGVVFNQAGTKAYVASWGSGNIYVIDTATDNVTATFTVGIHPEGIAISPDGSNVYVVNEGSNNISVIDTNTNVVTASINVGNKPVALGQFIASVPVQSLLPMANFSSNVTEGYAPLNVQFIDISLNKTGWYWDFGDGTNSTEENPAHTYSSSGNYSVNLTVSNGNITDSKLATINVSEQPLLPIVSFSTNVTSGYAPLSVQFMDDSILNEPNSSSVHRQKVITEADNGKNISLENGETFYIKLNYCPSCGYNFQLNVSRGLSVLSKDYIGDTRPEEPTPEGTTPFVGWQELLGWKIKAVAQGIQQIKGIYTRGDTTNDTLVIFSLNITNRAQNITSEFWDFGDGTNSTEQNPEHTFSTPGNYTINLTVSNKNGMATKSVTIYVLEQNYSSGGSDYGESNSNRISSSDRSSSESSNNGGSSSSSSSSGGSGGVSPEPQSNVEVKELSQTSVINGKNVKFDFSRNVTSVVYVNFDSKKTTGKTTTIVEMLKGKSTLVSWLSSDEVYKYLNIWVGNGGFATSKNIENAVVCFKVEKSWIQKKKIDKSTITLNRYNDKIWNQLLTTLSGEDDNYLYFTAKTPGFSSFAITGKSTATRTIQPAVDKTQNPTVNETQNNITGGSTAVNADKTPEQKKNPSSFEKGGTKAPGFESICGILSLLAVFLHKRK